LEIPYQKPNPAPFSSAVKVNKEMPKVLPSDDVVPSTTPPDVEKNGNAEAEVENEPVNASKSSTFKSLGLLDRFLALWIFLAMAIGIILGNFVPNTGPALQKGKFVGVSVPIGLYSLYFVTE
jgi:ACR3 family arsenite transporter